MKDIIPYIGAIIAVAGITGKTFMYVGQQENRVTQLEHRIDQLERMQRYMHGNFQLPSEAK